MKTFLVIAAAEDLEAADQAVCDTFGIPLQGGQLSVPLAPAKIEPQPSPNPVDGQGRLLDLEDRVRGDWGIPPTHFAASFMSVPDETANLMQNAGCWAAIRELQEEETVNGTDTAMYEMYVELDRFLAQVPLGYEEPS
ncbi:MAG: hypothetical protein ACO1SV_21440 [Fimbriimonas sp.]